jgi:nucleotidyltransferase/DNA polymerase involved in DNA repair
VLDPLPVKRLPGLGRKKGEQVVAAGITTLGELRRAPDARLWPLFGRDSARIRDRAAGIDERPVETDWEEKSISTEETFHDDIADPNVLRAELARLADKASGRLRAKQLVASCVTVKIRRHDFETHTRQRRLTPATHDSRNIARLAEALLATWLAQHPGAKLRLLGVGVSELAPAEQLDLFDSARPVEATRLDAALDAIRGKFGGTALQRASSLRMEPGNRERVSQLGEARPPRFDDED